MLRVLIMGTTCMGSIAHMDPEEACSLNGVMKGHACDCDQGWKGPRCSQLDLLPAEPETLGYRNVSMPTWYGSIVKEKSGAGRYHMFAVARAIGKGPPLDDYFGE